MSVLNRLACSQGRRDEVPNQELAHALAATEDQEGIREIAVNLWHKDPAVQSDCIKVLYEIGYLKPALIAEYAGDFLKLLKSHHNRLVWGGMIALSTVAGVAADVIYPQRAEIQRAMARGSVITVDAGVLTLAIIAATSAERCREIFPYLINHLQTYRPKDVPQHAEKILIAVNDENRREFIRVLEQRMEDLSGAEVTRVKRLLKPAGR
jgi:hypothetical protein